MGIIENFEKNEHSLWKMLERAYHIDCYGFMETDTLNKIESYKKEMNNGIITQEEENKYFKPMKNKKEKDYFFSRIMPLKRDFYIGKYIEKSLDVIRDNLRYKQDDIWYKATSVECERILPEIRKLCHEIYMFNKNAEIELNFFFKHYTTKPLMSWKQEGEDEQFGLYTTDILKSK